MGLLWAFTWVNGLPTKTTRCYPHKNAMPKKNPALTDIRIKAEIATFRKSDTKKKTVSDGQVQGLRLCLLRGVDGAVSSHWEFRQVAKTLPDGTKIKACEKRIGVYPSVGLKDARDKAEEYRRLVESGTNPIDEIKRQKEEAKALAAERERAAVTFEQASIQWIADNAEGWAKKNRRREKKVRSTLNLYVWPVIGAIPVDAVSAHDVYKVMMNKNFILNKEKSYSRQARDYINQVCHWAYCKGIRRSSDKPASTAGESLLAGLLKPIENEIPRGGHFPMIDVADAHEFFADLLSMPSTDSRNALIFGLLTGLRGQAFRNARWSAIDLNEPSITVDEASRKTKGEGDFDCFLSDYAVRFLNSCPRYEGDYIFSSDDGLSGISDTAVAAVIRRMNARRSRRGLKEWRDWSRPNAEGEYRVVVPHAMCRALMQTWSEDDEHGNLSRFPSVVSELVLDHNASKAKGDALNGSYRRGNLKKSRIDLMNYYGRYLITGKWPDEDDGEECPEWIAVVGRKTK